MSKAKELARAIKEEYLTTNLYLGAEIVELIERVLSEPEPDLKGWIEVEAGEIPMMVNISRITTYHNQCIFFSELDRIVVKESYDSIKQRIKEAS